MLIKECGTMDEFEISADLLRQMQLKSLDILLYFDSFCKSHDLTYFLCGGCCIGAVRHGGFIPWDDDIDVFMPRRDYETLKEVWTDTGAYSIEYPTREHPTQRQIITICDNNTTVIKKNLQHLDICQGLVLEILPLDGCPTGIRRKMQIFWALLCSIYMVGRAPVNHGKGKYYLGKLALSLVPFKSWQSRLWRFCERKMTQYPMEDCDYVTELCAGTQVLKNAYPKSCFSHAIPMNFEGHMFSMPADYDTYLRMVFGDYMQLPPEEEQVFHHDYAFIDLENSYRIYRGKKYFTKAKA